MDVKDPSIATRKWEEAIPRVGAAYKDGISKTTNFKEKAIAGEELYKQKVIEAANNERRRKGLEKITDEKWKNGALNKGAQRIGPGMQAAKADFQKGITEVINELKSIDLPPRTADPATNVQNRVVPIAVRLHERFKK